MENLNGMMGGWIDEAEYNRRAALTPDQRKKEDDKFYSRPMTKKEADLLAAYQQARRDYNSGKAKTRRALNKAQDALDRYCGNGKYC